MPYYWQHDDMLDEPPGPLEVTCRRPRLCGGRYWETTCSHKADAMDQLWAQWERATGCQVPPRIRRLRPQQPGLHSFPVLRKTSDERRVQRAGESGT